MILLILLFFATIATSSESKLFSELIFPLQSQHTHGPTIVECPNGDLLAAWFQGSGERWADDVAIMGARLKKGRTEWSTPFVMVDVPDFPDINPVMFIDSQNRLWLFWYTVIANQWETSLPRYCYSSDYQTSGPPNWAWQDVLLVKPGGKTERGIQPDDPFVAVVERKLNQLHNHLLAESGISDPVELQNLETRFEQFKKKTMDKASGQNMVRSGRLYKVDGSYEEKPLGYPYFRRMGWQTKNKPLILNGTRLLVPLYSDGFSFSLFAITEDWGKTWQFSEPLVGAGNIQPSLVVARDGTLRAYMRDNGQPPKRLLYSDSNDGGKTWSMVRDSELPNPGAGTDAVTLANGHWVLVYNDTERGRHSLAVSLSTDNGATWSATRHLEKDDRPEGATSSHYPAVIQGADGTIHVVYSYFINDKPGIAQKSIKYARFTESWLTEE